MEISPTSFIVPPVTQEQMDTSISTALSNYTTSLPAFIVANSPTPFVNSGAYQTVAQLLANYPAGVATLGMYGRVNDLWGGVRSVMVCEYDGTSYYWRPQRTDYAVPTSTATGNISLVPLVTAPVLKMTATLTGNVTITPTSTNVWPGAQFRVITPASIPVLLGISLTGIIGGTLPLLAGTEKVMTYTSAGWA